METESSPELRMLCESLKKFMEKDVAPSVEAIDHFPVVPEPEGYFSTLLSKLHDLGLLSFLSPSESGKTEGFLEILAAATGTMAEIYASVPALILAHSMARYLLAEHGTEEQKQKWLAPAGANGRVPLLAFPMYLEPDGSGLALSGSQDANKTVTLQGTCELVVNSPLADGLLLAVRAEEGMGLVLLPREAQGVGLSAPILTLGLRGCPVADVEARGIQIPEEAILGEWGKASLTEAYRLFSGPVAALCAGICTGSLLEAAAYVKERRQGGHRLEEYSQVRMMIASMVRHCEVARTAADILSGPANLENPRVDALLVTARDGTARAVQDGVQLLGGYGYMEDYGQERRMRDAKQAQMLLGRDDLRRLEMAGACLKLA